MIVFNKPSITNNELEYTRDAILSGKHCGDGKYTKKVSESFNEKFGIDQLLLTTSCTHALELSGILADIKEGDEFIVPSYTFVSTINAFIIRGAKPIFVDIDPLTMNIDSNKIEEKITDRTKAIIPVHYAGVVCDMDKINEIANRYNLVVIEDAAQAVGSYYKGKVAGTIGDMGCYSFHETKNYSMGEGGAIIIKDEEIFKRAEVIREKGTDRSQFIRGQVDKYTWKDLGSSYLPSDVLAAMLYGQMERFGEIMKARMDIWNRYQDAFEELEKKNLLRRPFIPEYTTHNAHMYYLILNNREERDELIAYLKENNIMAPFHYIPLHSAPMGSKLGCADTELPITDEYAGRLLRLPLFVDLTEEEQNLVIKKVNNFCYGDK